LIRPHSVRTGTVSPSGSSSLSHTKNYLPAPASFVNVKDYDESHRFESLRRQIKYELHIHYSKMLMISNQLAGHGSVNIPTTTTAGANPYRITNRECWKTKLMSNNFNAMEGIAISLAVPVGLRLFGTGMILKNRGIT